MNIFISARYLNATHLKIVVVFYFFVYENSEFYLHKNEVSPSFPSSFLIWISSPDCCASTRSRYFINYSFIPFICVALSLFTVVVVEYRFIRSCNSRTDNAGCLRIVPRKNLIFFKENINTNANRHVRRESLSEQ